MSILQESSQEAGCVQKTVLLVDDSKIVRTFIKVHLVKRKFAFLEAADGDEALALANDAHVDLVIADLHMPNKDGLSLLRDLRGSEQANLRDVPVILLTGEELAEFAERATEAGATAFLNKPVSNAGLLEVVERVLPEVV